MRTREVLPAPAPRHLIAHLFRARARRSAERTWVALIIIAGIAVMRGSVMPWVTVNRSPHGSISVVGTKAGPEFTHIGIGDGWVSFAFGLVLVVIGGLLVSGVPRWLRWLALAVATGSVGFSGYEGYRGSGALDRLGGGGATAAHPALTSHLAMGLFVVLVSSVLALIAAVRVRQTIQPA